MNSPPKSSNKRQFIESNNNVSVLISKFELRDSRDRQTCYYTPSVHENLKMETFSRREHRYSLPENQMIFDERMFFDNRDIPQPAKLRYRRAYNDSLASSINESDYFDHEPLVTQQNVTEALTRTSRVMEFLSRLPWPRLSVTGMGIVSFFTIFIAPKAICATILYPGFRLLFGTLYPAYASYKAVRTKNVKEYVSILLIELEFLNNKRFLNN